MLIQQDILTRKYLLFKPDFVSMFWFVGGETAYKLQEPVPWIEMREPEWDQTVPAAGGFQGMLPVLTLPV